ncbi:MAG: trypsin-like peptidase domain-containing protein [Opitutae bacterium]|nr:trypsin-like peptidase domain-containing protein [Opitutae bacterium]
MSHATRPLVLILFATNGCLPIEVFMILSYARKAFVAPSLVAVIFLTGCETTDNPRPATAKPAAATGTATAKDGGNTMVAQPPAPSPISLAPGGSRPVSFQRVIFNIEPGTAIGKFYWGPLKLEKDTLKAPSLKVGSEDFALIARDELRKANYSLLGGENLVFGSDESAKARYQLGAQVTGMKLDVYGSMNFWSGKQSVSVDGGMTADWQVYDTFTRSVIYTEKTVIDLKSTGGGQNEIFTMFRKSIRALLASEKFAAFMRPPAAGSDAKASLSAYDAVLRLTPAHYDKPRALPAEVPVLLDSVVTIKPGSGFGSGFIISADGCVLTAAHVVSGLKTVPVRLRSGLVLDADVLRLDDGFDVALLKLPGSSHQPIELDRAGAPTAGGDAYALGCPAMEELSSSVTKGVVSGAREIAQRKFIQTDVKVNPGNSGGPLVDKDGRAFGIISWKISAPGYEGLAFAIPLSEALKALNLDFGK